MSEEPAPRLMGSGSLGHTHLTMSAVEEVARRLSTTHFTGIRTRASCVVGGLRRGGLSWTPLGLHFGLVSF
jgi:hypothetical protein